LADRLSGVVSAAAVADASPAFSYYIGSMISGILITLTAPSKLMIDMNSQSRESFVSAGSSKYV
jgi:hypothetical protein